MYTLEKVWPEWKVVKEIGRGSYGIVYKCVKEEKNHKKYAAVKVISVPRDEYEMEDVVSEKMTQEQSKAYYKDIADDLLKEIEILKSLKGTKNIVEIYDAQVVEKEDGIGWNIYISMEMLTDFTTYASDKKFSQEDVIKLGTDLCSALSVCHKARIIHRDIKPENIFVDDFGNFKLGDFGVAKQMAKTKGSVSGKGTYGYMSPEVFSGKKCDGRADLYSLALVMYKLLNNNRFPFIDAGKQIVKYSERQQAFERRIKGESIPAIKGISNELNTVILKACSFKSVDRQRNIDEFRKQLESVGKGKKTGKKIRTALVAVLSALVVVSTVTGILYASNDSFKTKVDSFFGKKPDTEQGPEIGIKPKEITSLGMGLNEHNSLNGEYLVEGKGVNAGKYYLVDGNATVKNLSILPNIKEGHRVLAYNGKKFYYSVKAHDGNGFDVYRYNLEKNISSAKPYIKNVNIDSIVYFDDNYMYFTEIVTKPSGKEPKILVKQDLVKGSRDDEIEEFIEDVFEYNGYIIYSLENGTHYKYYDVTVGSENDISDRVIAGSEIYAVDDKLYFAEKTENGNIVIKYFNFKATENKTDALESKDDKSDIKAEDNNLDNLEAEGNANIIADLGAIDSVKDMTEASWKINGFLNDKNAIVYNEKAQDDEDKWYIWSYGNDSPEFNPIVNADKLFVEGNYEIFADGNTVKVAVWEDYVCEIYKIDSEGYAVSVSCKCAKGKKDGSYRIGSKYLTTDGDSINPAIDFNNVTFIEKEETVYPIDEAKAYMIPYDTTDDCIISINWEKAAIGLTKLAEGNDNWSKVIVDDEIVYIHTDKLRGYELLPKDITNLTAEVEKTYSVKEAELIDYVNSGDEYTLFFTAKNNGAIPYDVILNVVATLNGNKAWEIKQKEKDSKAPQEFKAFKNYKETGAIDSFPEFSMYDINGDGIYELIAHKESGKKHGVYIYNQGTGKGEKFGVGQDDNKIKAKSFELYEIKDWGVLCYYDKPSEIDGVINLIVVGINDTKVIESKLAYTGSKENIVKVESFKMKDYANVLS